MISFDLKKKWINDQVKPIEFEKFNLSDEDLTGGWEHIDDHHVYKVVERVIGYYRRRLLLTCRLELREDGDINMILVNAEEVSMN